MTVFSPFQIVQLQGFGVTGTGVSDDFTLTGIKKGDLLVSAQLITSGKSLPVGNNSTGTFRPIVKADDTMQQNGGSDFSTFEFTFTFIRLNQEA